MTIVSVMYPARPGSRFDMGYYLGTHMTMVQKAWGAAGMSGYKVLRGSKAADGVEPFFQVIVNMEFTSAAAFEAAVADSGARIMGDLPNFTDIQPTIQVSELADSFPAIPR